MLYEDGLAVWDALRGMEETFFLWNVVPLHPHPPGAPFSNRAHNAAERAAGEAILSALIGLLRPERIIAVGRDAERAAARVADSRAGPMPRSPRRVPRRTSCGASGTGP